MPHQQKNQETQTQAPVNMTSKPQKTIIMRKLTASKLTNTNKMIYRCAKKLEKEKTPWHGKKLEKEKTSRHRKTSSRTLRR